MAELSDIIDEIDQLVDEQMAGGEPISGYDYNDPDFPKCPHCDRDFHGIPLTERILEMRHRTGWDENYRVDADDSLMVCEGSLFIGPIRPQRIRVSAITIGHNPSAPWMFFSEQVYEDSVVPGLSGSVLEEMIRSAYLYAHDIATEVLGPQEVVAERIQAIVDTLVTSGLLDSTDVVPNPPLPHLYYPPAVIGQSEGRRLMGLTG
ncbi:MAG: hypothetical protein ACRDTI_10785 [Mycobacterium sp.]